jgi:biopolymer transport protein ExbD
MRVKLKREMRVIIPTASMSDIAFLLIIFFMLTTVFRKEIGLQVILPRAKKTERILKSRNVSNIYIDKDNRISVEDHLVDPQRIVIIYKSKILENPSLIAQLKVDKRAKYGRVNDVLEALREAQALRIVFATEFKQE